MNLDVRWRQRLSNFQRAESLLCEAFARGVDALSDLEKEGVVQRFEYTFELAWKTLKDYLEYTGVTFSEVNPRRVIKAAFTAGLIADGELWIEMMLLRNRFSHQYDEKMVRDALSSLAHRHLPALAALRTLLEQRTSA